jgi:hypothetical protein
MLQLLVAGVLTWFSPGTESANLPPNRFLAVELVAKDYNDLIGATLRLGKDDYIQIESLVAGIDQEFDFFYPYIAGTLSDGSQIVIDNRSTALVFFDNPACMGGFYLSGPTGAKEWIEELQLGVDPRGRMAIIGKKGISESGDSFSSIKAMSAFVDPCIRVAGFVCLPGPGCPAASHDCEGPPPGCACSSGTGTCKLTGTWGCPDDTDCPIADPCVIHVVMGEFQCHCM